MKLLLSLFSLLLTCSAFAQNPASGRLEAALEPWVQKGWSGSALVYQKGETLLDKGFGMADREAKTAQTAATVFSIGSITKQFTAAAILKLESMDKLKLDDPLSRFFPEAPADKAGITLHQLLTHTAGFAPALGDDYDQLDAAAFIQLAFGTPLEALPGARYDYSNVGYSILGIIVEKTSGKGYETFLREQLWLPSGMEHTGYLLQQPKKSELAVGYRDGQRWGTALDRPWLKDGPGWHLRANGGVLSTASDMLKWYKSLKNNTVLPPSATTKMFMPQVAEGPGGQSHYGYGWVIQQVDGKRLIWHNGGNMVYNANMTFFPDEDICIFVSSNSNNIISDDVAVELLGALWNKPLKTNAPGAEEPYRNNPVTRAIHAALLEKGPDYFRQNSDAVLRQAGFDFDNDMQLLGVGEMLEEAGKWPEAIALFETYTRLFPGIVVAWNRLGVCRKAMGDIAGARAAWEKSVALRPNNPAARWLKELD